MTDICVRKKGVIVSGFSSNNIYESTGTKSWTCCDIVKRKDTFVFQVLSKYPVCLSMLNLCNGITRFFLSTVLTISLIS